ncbi:hypothetical protein B0I35DRAFT_435650 [Stachybotrys elegans]|uniref:Stress-response A/B barrel domain-containing protein n=1 Tax=Stachybotrys elegans TaxID=80388 RepID=A0A8K0SPR0_9HYPO|nr:hypothetical protein B0I35DRAFT_435650 [Stachybotrys elegans]
MMDLGKNCIHSTTGKPYIKSIRGGRNIAKGNRSANRTHAFVVEFDNAEDRDYYLDVDEAHSAFVEFVAPMLASPNIAVDFRNDEF